MSEAGVLLWLQKVYQTRTQRLPDARWVQGQLRALQAEGLPEQLEWAMRAASRVGQIEGHLGVRLDALLTLHDGAAAWLRSAIAADATADEAQIAFCLELAVNALQALSEAYLAVIDGLSLGGRLADDYREKFLQLASHTGDCLLQLIKAKQQCYRDLEEDDWAAVARYWQWLERRQLLDAPAQPRAGARVTTPARQLQHLLLLHISAAGNLQRRDIALLDHLAEHLADALPLGKSISRDSSHVFDLTDRMPPQRLSGKLAQHGNMRFFGAAALLPQLELMFTALRAGATPHGFKLPAGVARSTMMAVIQHAWRHWQKNAPTRRYQRRSELSAARVIVSYSAFSQLALDDSGDDLNELALVPRQIWQIRDFSAKGFAASVPVHMAPTLQVGEMLGVRFQRAKHWSLAVVKRLSRDAGQWEVGAQLISLAARPVRVLDTEQLDGAPDAAIIVGKGDILLTPRGRCQPSKPYRLIDANGVAIILPQQVTAQGNDLDRVQFACT